MLIDHTTMLRDKNGILREIPFSSLQDADFKLFGLTVSQIGRMRTLASAYAEERGHTLEAFLNE